MYGSPGHRVDECPPGASRSLLDAPIRCGSTICNRPHVRCQLGNLGLSRIGGSNSGLPVCLSHFDADFDCFRHR